MKTSRVAILGASGLAGQNLLALLANHPSFTVETISSDSFADLKLKKSIPSLAHLPYSELTFQNHSEAIDRLIENPVDLVFLATPNQFSWETVPLLFQKTQSKIIDLSGVFRIPDEETYQQAYDTGPRNSTIMSHIAYGLTEFYSKEIRSHRIVANPGCYPVSCLIPIRLVLEALQALGLTCSQVVIDSKSGTSGAGGRVEGKGFSFFLVYENFKAYKIGKHQHQPEIATHLADFISPQRVLFTPHLLPLFRGILSTIYLSIDGLGKASIDFQERLKQLVNNFPFVRLVDDPNHVDLRRVQGTNFIDFGYHIEDHTLILVSAIDNLIKGASGQAIQNANVLFNLPQTTGLL